MLDYSQRYKANQCTAQVSEKTEACGLLAGKDNIFWSTYLLQEAESDGTWFSGRPLASFSLFGRTSQVSIPEPGTWSLMLAALIALVAVTTVGRYTLSPN